jgi:hypothetical protein
MTDPKQIGAWAGLGFMVVTLLGLLWAGFQKLDDVNDLDELVDRMALSINRLDSLTTTLDRYRRHSICRQGGYDDPSTCPLLMAEMGLELLTPRDTAAMMPEIP